MNQLKKYPAYKDSGIDWIGEIPEHWEVLPFKAISKVFSETNYPKEELLSIFLDLGVIPFSSVSSKRTNSTSENLNNYQLVKPGNFVLNNQQAWRGSVGISFYRGIISPAYIVLELINNINGRYANYLLRSPIMIDQYVISSKGVGTIQRNLYWNYLKNCNIPLPPLSEQKKIASFLEKKTAEIDKAIELKEKENELLQERRQVAINQAVSRGLHPHVRYKDSGVEWIGEIPEHWEVRKAKRLFKKENRLTRKTDEVITCFRDGEVTLRKNRRVGGFTNSLKEIGYQGIRKGDLIIHAMDAFAGAIGVSDSDGKGTPVYSVCTPIIESVNNYFYAYLLRYMSSKKYIEALAKGIRERSTDFRFTEFAKLSLPLPPLSEQKEIAAYLEDLDVKTNRLLELNKQSIAKLKEYKQVLIDQAVRGQICLV